MLGMANDGLAPGTVLQDTYRIIRQVGHGGMGAVYEATHARLAGRYAVKVLKPDTAETPEAFQRFRREALVTSGLRHPGIVQVIDFNQAPDGSPYLVMEFLDGVELAQLIAREAPMPLARVAEIVQQIASALGAAHKQGIVHRDLKPQNVFVQPLDDGRELVKVVDFGISKVQALSLKLTNESALLGTPQYMAPEHVVSKGELDGRADEFALAAIGYEMLTGRCPFQGETVMSLVYQIVNAEPAPVAAFNATIDAAAERVLRRALAKAPGQRFPTIQEFGAAFAAAAGLAPVPARPVTPAARVAAPGSAATPDGQDVRFSTTLQASTGQVRAAARRASRARIAGGALGIAAIGAIAAFAVWRPPLILRGGASHVVAPATPAPNVTTPAATQAAPPPPTVPAPAPAEAAPPPRPIPTRATGHTAAKKRPPASRRRGGNNGRRVADETTKAETPHRAREVLSDDL
jgi:eukaryotic-like serine/threonine-protein kinase